ncbi:MAG: restriction endonuclease [Clostridia bacterium]|jgi:hypothetical protein
MEVLIFFGIIFVLAFLGWVAKIYYEHKSMKINLLELQERLNKYDSEARQFAAKKKELKKKEDLFLRLFRERTQNYPVVGEAWSNLIEITESERERALRYKSHPALRAADEIKFIKIEKKELVKELISWKYKAANYEAIYPWLVDELGDDIQDNVDANIFYSVYTEQERADPVAQYISPEAYRSLSVTERNQLALERYWLHGKKSKWMIGKMYERYTGYLYEKSGWDVQYFGIQKRYEDLGRDLIAKKGNVVHVIQCKHWSKFKTIYENHIFQLFGTAYSMGQELNDIVVTPVFYTSTLLSDTANEFSKLLGIKVKQGFKFSQYPCIKCNISPKGEKIYHLPFDQQYDTTKITPKKGELYAETVAEAERLGFRRAFKWTGNK